MDERSESHPASPAELELDRLRALTVTWPDGLRVAFALDDLRAHCPCAECRSRREQGLPAGPRPSVDPPIEAVGAELVGGWGVTIRWSDGHKTGIYAWDRLRRWAESGDEGDVPGESDDAGQAAGPT